MPSASKLHYFFHSPEDRHRKNPPILLIHGAGGNCSSWPPQIRRLPRCAVYAPDLPGHGRSEGVGRQTVEAYADDIHEFMDGLKLRSAVLTGVSMGGAIALQFALKYPKQVVGLILLGSGSRLRVAPAILTALGSPNLFESAVDTINQNCFSADVSPRIKELSKAIMLEMRPTVMLGDFQACDRFDVTVQLPEIQIPTLILCGSEDKMTPPKYSVYLKESIAGAQLKILEGAGHMAMAEQPDVVAGWIAEFVAQHTKRKVTPSSRKVKRRTKRGSPS